MKQLVCSKCGYQTNAWVAGVSPKNVLCNGCHEMEQDGTEQSIKAFFVKGSPLADSMIDAVREYNNLPKWQRIPEERMKNATSYADI